MIGFLIFFYVKGTYIGYKMATEKEKSFCGTIQNKVVETYYHKSSGSTDYFLLINFEGVGRHDVEVARTTYFKFNEGDRICFTFDADHFNPDRHGFKNTMYEMWGVFVGYVFNGVILIALLVIFIGWIFTGKNIFEE
jgi:hypothetical protein